MGSLDDLKTKTEGKKEEIQGEAEEKISGVKGGMKKMKGKAKQKGADITQDVEKDIAKE